MGSKVVAITSTKYTSNDLTTQVRHDASLETFAELMKANIPVVVCDASFSNTLYRQQLKSFGVIIVDEPAEASMGQGRRLTMHKAFTELCADYVLWLEPEKTDLVKHISSIVDVAHKKQSDILLVGRSSLASYPLYQQQTETLVNEFAAKLAGIEGDSIFGPRLFNAKGVRPFLDYPLLVSQMSERYVQDPEANPCRDLWDSIYIPSLFTLMKGDSSLSISYHNVDFCYPTRQREAEEYDCCAVEKRYSQACALMRCLSEIAESLSVGEQMKCQQIYRSFKRRLDNIVKPIMPKSDVVSRVPRR